jgi:hypothetical protein
MTTDKVRVEIRHIGKDTIVAYFKMWFNQNTFAQLELSEDHDNWIDITLPEEIDGETKFKVCISYTDKWKAKMRMKPEGWNSKNIVGRNRIYELQVTVY